MSFTSPPNLPPMSHDPAPYGTTAPAGKLPFTPLYRVPTPLEQAQWSEARLGQECGLWLQAAYPQAYALFFHIPNGGLRTPVESVAFKCQHAKAGVPDYLLAKPRFLQDNPCQSFYYHGLFLELKTRTGRVKPEQTAWHERLRQQGYRVEVVRSLPEFMAVVSEYLA